jgi:hypothetical protein
MVLYQLNYYLHYHFSSSTLEPSFDNIVGLNEMLVDLGDVVHTKSVVI